MTAAVAIARAPAAADTDRRRSDAPSSDAGGSGLPAVTRSRLESTLGVGLGDVRVHDDAGAATEARSHTARAFTYGSHIFLGAGERSSDIGLMAHEAAHVVQQRSDPTLLPVSLGVSPGFLGTAGAERDAAQASVAATTGSTYTVTGAAPAGEAQYAEEGEGWLEGTVWDLVASAAPTLVSIIRRGATGVVDWIGEKVSSAVGALVDTVMAPVRAIGGVGTWLQAQFGPLVTSVQEAASRIAQNDCGPITEAAQKIEDVATRFIQPIVEKVMGVADKVGTFFKGLWDKFGAPAWDFVKQYGGKAWDLLKQLGEWIWDGTAPVRKLAARAWRWLKNKIGIGEGPEGQNGILQWIQGKVGTAWDWVQQKIAPYKQQITKVLTVIGGILLLFSPVGPVLIAAGAIYGVVQGVRWIRANLGQGDAIVRARTYVQGTLIPSLLGGINKMTAAISRLAGSVSSQLGSFASGIGGLVGAAAGSAMQFLVDGAQWLADRAMELATWANQKLTAFAQWVGTALDRLRAFLQPVLDFLGKVGRLVIDIFALPGLLVGSLWDRIPRCIRDPFVDWIIPLILKQIGIFRELVATPEAWQKTKADVMRIVRLVFVNKDLPGAMRATFDLILRVFNVPLELLKKVVAKAKVAWDTVVEAPLKFLKNCVRSVGRGLQLYADNLKDNLANGLQTWLFSELGEKGITPPASWTNPWDLAGFALSVIGLSISHVFDLMEQKIAKPTVDKLRKWYARLSKAWDWITEMRGKNPAEVTKAIITGAKDFAVSIAEQVVVWIVERVGAYLAVRATAAAASVGISEALEAIREIYNAIVVATRWMRQLVDMVDRALDAVIDIAAGRLDTAGGILTDAMKRATPVVIGFLAAQVGLGGLPQKLADIVGTLRGKVDEAILAVIGAVKSLLETIASGVKSAVAAVIEWWTMREEFTAGGEKHVLSFQGSEESAELMIESTPTLLKEKLAKMKRDKRFKDDDDAKVKFDAVDAQIKKIVTLRSDRRKAKAAKDSDGVTKADEGIRTAFLDIRKTLTGLLKSDDEGYGSFDDPIPLDWPYPSTSNYRVLYFGGKVNSTRLQSTLKGKKGDEDVTGTKIIEFRPQEQKALPGGEVIGLESKFYLTNGTKVGPLTKDTTGGGGKLLTILKPYGFTAESDDMDADHVHEVQFGGRALNDSIANLWPLAASLNRSKGSTLAKQDVVYPRKPKTPTTVADLKKQVKGGQEFWFKVTGTTGKG